MVFRRLTVALLLASSVLPLVGCFSTHHTVEASVKPIHVTLDVNLRVEKELDNFFGELDEENPLLDQEATPGKPAESTPSSP